MTKVLDTKALTNEQLAEFVRQLIELVSIQEHKIDALARSQSKIERLGVLLITQFNDLENQVNSPKVNKTK